MAQDRHNSLIIEKGIEHFRVRGLLEKDTSDYKAILRAQEKQLAYMDSIYHNEVKVSETTIKMSEAYKSKYKKEKKKRFATMIVSGVVIVLILL